MENNRGLIGWIIIGGIIAILLAGITIYISFSSDSFSLQTGKFTFSVDYNDSNSSLNPNEEISIIDRVNSSHQIEDQTQNITNQSLNFENINSSE
jgi:hypothetical protein